MAEIVKFAFILNENLNRKSFKVPQAIVQLDVQGAADPLTHQKARDAVSDLFHQTQKAINDDIAQRDLRITRMGVNERKLKKRVEIETGNKKIRDLLVAFEKQARERLDEWREKEEERSLRAERAQSRENWKGISFAFKWVWTGIKMGLELGETLTSPLNAPVALNSLVAGFVEVKGLIEDYGKIYADCPTMRKNVRNSLTAMKSKSKLVKSDVEALATDVGLLEDKLLVLETKSKSMSSRVTSLISAMPKKGAVQPEVLKKAEEALHECLTGLVASSEEIEKAQKTVEKLKKTVGLARANAKKDSTFAWGVGWAATAYTVGNDLKDFVLKPEEWVTRVDGAIKFFLTMGDLKVRN